MLRGPRGRARAAACCTGDRCFCAGADFASGETPNPTAPPQFRGQGWQFHFEAARVSVAPIPVIAAVQGASTGADFGLAMDLRVAPEGTGLRQSEIERLQKNGAFK